MNIPSQSIELAREDIASAASRTAAFSLPGDEPVTIPSLGFNLAGTITRPKTAAPAPALILIGGSGPTDRDETVAGIPIFGHVARDLVDAGFVVVRYDKRGVGQSGGRAESATIADYAEDVRLGGADWLEKQKDVDKERIGLVGHSEGALVAMLAAGRERGKVGAHGARRRSVDQRRRRRARTAEAPAVEDADRRCAARRRRWRCRRRSTHAVIKGNGMERDSGVGAARRRHAVVLQLPDLRSDRRR